MSKQIHPTALVADSAVLGEDVLVGPYCIIGENVKVGKGTRFHAHVVVDGHTTIGENNEFFQFCSIGAPPQDKTYKGEPTEVIIGDNNLFREGCSVHRATTKEVRKTVIGNNNYFMTNIHIAHDCVLGNNITLASACMLAGHVHLGDFVQMGGQCGVTPFITVGRGAFIGGATAIDRDIPPFCTAMGNRIRLKGINIIGLKRRGFSKEVVSEVVDFYRVMESSALSPRAFVTHGANMEEYINNEVISEVADFIKKSEIGLPPFIF